MYTSQVSGKIGLWAFQEQGQPSAVNRKTLFQALLEARQTYGRKRVVVVDASRKTANYDQLIAVSMVLRKFFVSKTQKNECVGILLPGSIATVALFLWLSRWGRVPAMLNYTAGVKNIRACCAAVRVKTIVTSRRFVETGIILALRRYKISRNVLTERINCSSAI
ncbi:MAG: hypothetical protein LBJ36_07895 [Synergistaceae bacterium]|jgi:acyl-[acyl-carrier-protein]-phospholipid O-acyltransferase/long-chain-fatty-acid--[acyl-carrier-protein] ligase|nr:hypothetical protein [Synergistaceae bacterium]